MGTRGARDPNRGNFFRSQDGSETAVDTWDNTIATNAAEQSKTDDTWGDWDNEEYTGSLADTKVFTPSAVQNPTITHSESLAAPPGLEQPILSAPATAAQLTDDLVQPYSAAVANTTAGVGGTASAVSNTTSTTTNQVQYPDLASTTASHLRPTLDQRCEHSNPILTCSTCQSHVHNLPKCTLPIELLVAVVVGAGGQRLILLDFLFEFSFLFLFSFRCFVSLHQCLFSLCRANTHTGQ